MESKQQNNKILTVWINVCRFVLAATFIFSGFTKAVDPLGTNYKIEDYLTAFGIADFIPNSIPIIASILLSGIEFIAGSFLLFGVRRKVSTAIAFLLMLVMTPFTLYLALKNPVSDCGCFGDAFILTNWQTFWKNVILLIAAISVVLKRRLIIRFIQLQTEWIVSMYTILFIFVFAVYNLRYIPVLDFRPFKIGNNIQQGMSIPEGKSATTFETIFILKKDGIQKEFTLENYPDSTWTFVTSKTSVKEKGYEPPITNFSISLLETGEDITTSLLTDKNYTFLLIANRIETADEGYIDLINEIYDYSLEHNYKFYCVTSSEEDEINLWMDRTGAEYPFCQSDDITLKTMIRSNPGLLLLKEGTILNKWSCRNLPDEYILTDKLENIPLGKQKQGSDLQTLVYIALWYFLPLLIVVSIDKLYIYRKNRKKSNTTNK